MNKFIIKKYLREVNDEVVASGRKVRLKASMTVVVTNYSKLRYYTIGNTRFYLYRDGYLKLKSRDESLTQQMADKQLIPLDKISRHEERNNLTSYLGENNLGGIDVSKKIKLCDKDVFVLLTRGIWENCDAKEIEEALEGVHEPKQVLDDVEDIILSKQPSDLQNYTIAATFADKVYINPERKKKAIMIAIPIIILLIVLLVALHIRNNKKLDEIADMHNYETSAEDYISNDNIEKANEDYKNALDIAKKYKLDDDMNKLDEECKYTDLIMQADQLLEDKKYDEALDKYIAAADKNSDVDNIGKEYINKKLDITKNCITVADLLSLADEQLEAGDDKSAEANYLEAKRLALNSYLKDEKKEAMDKLQQIYDDRKKAADEEKADADKAAAEQKQAEDDAKKKEEEDAKKAEEEKKAAQELMDKAIDLRKNGDQNYVSGDYVSAKMYYALAKEAFEEIGSISMADELEEKIELMDRKITDNADKKEEADKYLEEASTKYLSGDYTSAKVLYLLAKDIYDNMGLTEDSEKVNEKINAIGENNKSGV